MKKLLLLACVFALSACTGHSGGSEAPAPAPATIDNSKPLQMGGTVSLLIRLVLPQAHAMGIALPTHFDTAVGTLPSDLTGVTCAADRCVFLVDTGTHDSGSTVANTDAKVIAATPLVDGKFSFTLDTTTSPALARVDDSSNPTYQGKIYKLIVRNWDQSTQTPAAFSAADDREFTLSSNDLKSGSVTGLEVNPESTISARRRENLLKNNFLAKEDGSFVQSVMSLFKQAAESIHDAALRMLASIAHESNDSATFLSILSDASPTIDTNLYAQSAAGDAIMAQTPSVSQITDLGSLVAKLNQILTQVKIDAAIQSDMKVKNNLSQIFTDAATIQTDISNYRQAKTTILNYKSEPTSTTQDQYDAAVASKASLQAKINSEVTAFLPACEKVNQYIRIWNAINNLQTPVVWASGRGIAAWNDPSVGALRAQIVILTNGESNSIGAAKQTCTEFKGDLGGISANLESNTVVTVTTSPVLPISPVIPLFPFPLID